MSRGIWLLLTLTGLACKTPPVSTCASCATKAKQAAPIMAAFSASGFALEGAEYWPYHDAREPSYPDEVLWGFYPEKGVIAAGETTPNVASASPAAVNCATKAWLALNEFLHAPPPALHALATQGQAAGYTNLFYLWTNDYSTAVTPFPTDLRAARLWYWKRKVPKPNRPAGFWKWEATLDQQGQCHLPDRKAAEAYLTAELTQLNAR